MLTLPTPHEVNLRRVILPYLCLPLVTALFYLLGAVTGSQTRYWWIEAELNGVTWQIGGLESCQRQGPCPANVTVPSQANAAHGCLQYHFAVAPVIVLAAVMHHRTSSIHEGWPSLASCIAIPGVVFAFTFSSWLADILLVHSSFKASREVTALSIKPSYWLSTAGFGLTLVWLLLAEFYRRCRHAQHLLSLAPPKPRRKRPPTTLEKVTSWWPWAR